MSARLAVAASSPLAARAGAATAEAGGNAVDAAIAAMLVSVNTEPGVCSLAGGAYLTLRRPGEPPLTLDGYIAVPGSGDARDRSDRCAIPVHLEYGGGVDTVIGADSIGVPGGVALFGVASRDYGRLPWPLLFEPVIEAARSGFPLPQASRHYLEYSAGPIFDRSPDGRSALRDTDGELKQIGDTVIVPHLADSLDRIARHGPDEFYTGELGRTIARYVIAQGGRLNEADLENYEVIPRPSLLSALDGWQIGTNPPPAIGGAVLSAMLQLLGHAELSGDEAQRLRLLIEVQRAVLGFRRKCLDGSEDVREDVQRLLGRAGCGDLPAILESGSTCHVSAVDDSGLACAITMSAGYGCGEMAPGTGIWLNNCLGELELNKRGLQPGPPGSRLPSNMAPTVASHEHGAVLAIGSPGADRITTAILQALFNHLRLGMDIETAVRAPRAHVEFTAGGARVACEGDLPADRLPLPVRQFPGLSMYFGGVGMAAHDPVAGFAVAADPRRTGGTWSAAS